MPLRRPVGVVALLAMTASLLALLPTSAASAAPSTSLVISQVYGGGGNSGAPFQNDYVELYNRGTDAASTADLSLQYASATGTGNLGANAGQLVALPAASVPAGGSFLVQLAGGSNGAALPAPDATGTINAAAGAGTFALATGTSSLGCNGGSTLCSPEQLARVVDLVGYGSASFFEGSGAAPSLSNTTAALRAGNGAQDTDDNAADFTAGTPNPRNSGSAQPDPDPDPDPEPGADQCLVPAAQLTRISQVQGAGAATPIPGQSVVTRGVVTADFTSGGESGIPANQGSRGFYLEALPEDRDADPLTSEGVFAFEEAGTFAGSVGTLVAVAGTATESFGQTQITATDVDVCEAGPVALPAPAALPLPVAPADREDRLEPLEGMRVTHPELTVVEHFQLERFGEVRLSSGGVLDNPTNVVDPRDDAAYEQVVAFNAANSIILDDGRTGQNLDPLPYVTPGETLRIGDQLRGATTVLGYGFNAYRLQPVDVDELSEQLRSNRTRPRPLSPPEVGGDLTVASFNVLNYFDGDGQGGGFPTSRGAVTPAELERQTAKLVAALREMDADVVGLMEIENDGGPLQATRTLVEALNAAYGSDVYSFVDTGVIGTDAIKQAFLYKTDTVEPAGDFAVLDSSVDSRFDDGRNRPVLAQTFTERASGEAFTVAVNHLKSKGSGCGPGDDDPRQGSCNGTRVLAAAAMVDWLKTRPTGQDAAGTLVIGDLNAYAEEDPIAAFLGNGYSDLLEQAREDGTPAPYTYTFDATQGRLDHALADDRLLPFVTGAAAWHINADEVPALDYQQSTGGVPSNQRFRTARTAELYYRSDAFRSSDHDPVLVGLQLAEAPVPDGPFRLTLLHNNDGESALLPGAGTGSGTAPFIGGIARFGTLVEELRARGDAEPGASGTLLVSSGDNYLAGPQLQASLENFDGGPDFTNDGPFYDAVAMDRLGYDASAVGNHEFDFGPDVLGYFISQFGDSNIRFVSSNLDVEGEQALEQFVAAPPGAPGTLVEWTRTTAAGVPVAIVGATTPRLASISSPGPDVQAREDLVPIVQDAIDEATADGTAIVLLISHLQNVNEDRALIAQLSGVDAAVAGGGDELLANDCRAAGAAPATCSTLLPNEGTPAGAYPLLQADAEGVEVPIVTTPGSYSYLGRLVLDLDAEGDVIGVDSSSGPVRNVFVAGDNPPADQRDPDPFLLENVERPVAAFVQGLRDERVARTEPELDGRTPSVRTRETNLGSLFADALVRSAEDGATQFGAERPAVGITNSGGIRNSVVLGPDGDISRFDTFQIAPFSNFVAYALDVSPETVKQVLERAVSAATTGGTLQPEGRFVQVSGLTLRYDPAQQAQEVTRQADGTVAVTAPGARVRDITLTRGTADPLDDVPLYRNGVLVAGAPNVDLASNSFSLANGDNLPFNLPEARRVNLPVSYQQSLEAYLRELQTVTRAQYPEGGLGRIVAGADGAEPEPENRAPVAAAGGGYTVQVGQVSRLDAGSSSDPDGDTLTFAWDLDGDGAFDDASGPTATFSGGRPPGSYSVAVQVSDGRLTSTATAVVQVVTPGRGNGGRPPGRF